MMLIKRLLILISFAAFYVWQLIVANFRLAYDVVRPTSELRPGIVAVPLDLQSDAGITVLSNLLTLTPGTLSLDISSDRKVLYIHAMNAADPDALRDEIKRTFERRVRELLA